MIEAEHPVRIDVGIDQVWDYVRDIRKWAAVFPGCRACDVISEHDSRWTLKVGAGGMVRTVNVQVHVDQWAGPEQVHFSYRLEGEPVVGSGSYLAARKGADQTEVCLKVCVEGSGPMAPMWEAVSRPLLPQLAKSFAGKLKADIEQTAALPAAQGMVAAGRTSVLARIRAWLRKIGTALFGSKTQR